MGWQKITYACGHTEEQQMYGKCSERDRHAEALGRYNCPDCRKAAADKAAAEQGLPALTGSPKQVAWAAEIRERALRLLPAERADKIRAEASARWWIDNRQQIGG